MFCWFPCFFSWKKPAETHCVLGAAGIVGNQFKFVGLHAVMLCKGFNFIATHVFLPKMGDAGGKTWQNYLKKCIIMWKDAKGLLITGMPWKKMGHLFGLAWTEEVSLKLSVSLFEVQFLGWKIFRWKFRAFFQGTLTPDWVGFWFCVHLKKKTKRGSIP